VVLDLLDLQARREHLVSLELQVTPGPAGTSDHRVRRVITGELVSQVLLDQLVLRDPTGSRDPQEC